MTILIVGATGTLGRQIVKQAINVGYPVRCLVRNIKKAKFLKEWGVELIYGDLTLPETLPQALKGITVVIDAATFRVTEELTNLNEVDLIGKLALIKAAKYAQVERFLFFSIMNNQAFSRIPLMKLKFYVEETLKNSKVSYTIFQLTGFFQGIIGQYALPIIDQQPILSTSDKFSISYIDTQDISKFCLRSLLLEQTDDKTFVLGGSKPWLSDGIIKLCENFSGQTAIIRFFPLLFLGFFINLSSFFKWSWELTDRLEFIEILRQPSMGPASFIETYKIFNINKILTLEYYLRDYFNIILIKLRNLNYNGDDFTNRKDLQF
tara:strand:- start:3315 stop:4277 length:963 start_codon:yes stop_codon:yes gene_type:complete